MVGGGGDDDEDDAAADDDDDVCFLFSSEPIVKITPTVL
jgi:hypothetical protein